MKRVLITLYRDKSHSLYKQFINSPPEGYKYLTLDDVTEEYIFTSAKNIFGEIVNKFFRNRKIIHLAKKNDIDLIYCCDGILLFNSPIPWIIDLEHVTGFISHHFQIWKYVKWILPFLLRQRNLKYIIPWTRAGAESIRKNIKLPFSIEKKIIPIHLCLKKSSGGYQKNDNPVSTLLFVTSVNYNSDYEFFSKGGRIVVKVYENLKKRGIDTRLILRSKLPKEYDFLRKDGRVEIYEDKLDALEFSELFSKASIFLFPGYQSPGLAFLDAMDYGLPILTTDVFANEEMVCDNINGFKVNFCKKNRVYYLQDDFGIKFVPSGKFAQSDHLCQKMIADFVDKTMYLLSHPNKLKFFGKNSKKLLLQEFSLEKRNGELKKIFDKSLDEFQS